MHSFLEQLNWRRAEKNFDPEYKLSDKQLTQIIQAIRLSPSSFGIQPYHVYVVGDQATKAKLRKKGYDQAQFTDASHLLVFATRTDIDQRITQYGEVAGAKDNYLEIMRGFTGQMDDDTKRSWAESQTYIALGFALAACAELGIDSCPMEGFDPAGFNEVLGIKDPMHSVVVMSIGQRKEEPGRDKIRFPNEDLFTII